MCKDIKLGERMVSMKNPNKISVVKLQCIAREHWVYWWREGGLRIRGSRISRIRSLRMKKYIVPGWPVKGL